MSLLPTTVRSRLALSLAVALALLLALFSASVYGLARKHLLAEVEGRVRQDLDLLRQELTEDSKEARELETKGLVLLYTVAKEGQPVHVTAGWTRLGLPDPASARTTADASHVTTADGRGFAVARGTVETPDGKLELAVARDETPARAMLARLAAILGVSLPVAIGAAFIGGSLLATRLLAPIGSMARAAGRITEERLSERLPVEDPADEFGKLATAFNQTVARIEEAFEKTRRFTSDASHELRTPLTALRSVGEAALRARMDAEGYRESIASMLEECDRLTRLVDGLLLLAREDTDAYRARFTRFDLGELGHEVVGVLRVLAEERGQQLETDLPSGILVHGDRTSMRQALFNLVDNAIKYTPPHGAIRVRLRTLGDSEASLEVADSGPGIALEHRERIFERFYRIESDRGRSTGGSGLGLSIARWAAELHGGRVDLETEEGRGSTFALRIPSAASA
jgi:heavy metal sensor kinase